MWKSEEEEVWNKFLLLEKNIYQLNETDSVPGGFPNVLFTDRFFLENEL